MTASPSVPRFSRLRWQLTFSHLKAVALTVVLMIAIQQLAVSFWLTRQDRPDDAAARDARTVSAMIGGLAARTDPTATADLDVVLRAIARGDLRPSGAAGWSSDSQESAQWQADHSDESGSGESGWGPPWATPASLRDLAYIVVTDANGHLRAGATPDGVRPDPVLDPAWDQLIARALSGEQNTQRLAYVRSNAPGAPSAETDEPATLGAYPIFDATQRPLGVVVVAKRTVQPPPSARSIGMTLIAIGAAATALVLLAAPFAVAPAAGVAYLLSRNLVKRLERLGAAAEALAAGNLTRRVEEGPPDEVGQLTRRFNRMTDQLRATLSELEQARANAEAALATKRDLVANVSHELRTPLALIRSHVESLLMHRPSNHAKGANGSHTPDRSDAREIEDYLAVIQRETDHLSRLIDDLFALSTAEAGALPLMLEGVPLAEVAQEVVDSVAPVARRERRVIVVFEDASGDRAAAHAWADRQRLVQILGNLIRNALRHTPAGGMIAVRTQMHETHGTHATLIVEDTGEGIPPERLPHVFQRFYRGGEGRDRASGGAGLGLAIVKELVEAMDGTVAVESEVGRGTRFIISLPLAVNSSQTGHTTAALR
jgi:signal transduction histidine kinase